MKFFLIKSNIILFSSVSSVSGITRSEEKNGGNGIILGTDELATTHLKSSADAAAADEVKGVKDSDADGINESGNTHKLTELFKSHINEVVNDKKKGLKKLLDMKDVAIMELVKIQRAMKVEYEKMIDTLKGKITQKITKVEGDSEKDNEKIKVIEEKQLPKVEEEVPKVEKEEEPAQKINKLPGESYTAEELNNKCVAGKTVGRIVQNRCPENYVDIMKCPKLLNPDQNFLTFTHINETGGHYEYSGGLVNLTADGCIVSPGNGYPPTGRYFCCKV